MSVRVTSTAICTVSRATLCTVGSCRTYWMLSQVKVWMILPLSTSCCQNAAASSTARAARHTTTIQPWGGPPQPATPVEEGGQPPPRGDGCGNGFGCHGEGGAPPRGAQRPPGEQAIR